MNQTKNNTRGEKESKGFSLYIPKDMALRILNREVSVERELYVKALRKAEDVFKKVCIVCGKLVFRRDYCRTHYFETFLPAYRSGIAKAAKDLREEVGGDEHEHLAKIEEELIKKG